VPCPAASASSDPAIRRLNGADSLRRSDSNQNNCGAGPRSQLGRPKSRNCGCDAIPLRAQSPAAGNGIFGCRDRAPKIITKNPTAEWISRQVTEAFPWDHAPRYLIRDPDTSYGPVFLQRIRAMGIRDHPIAPRSPWQNAYVERLIGSIHRERLDHMIVFGEAHLRRILRGYSRRRCCRR
jgi:hypothetical protein